MSDLRNQIIKLAFKRPDLRDRLLPLLRSHSNRGAAIDSVDPEEIYELRDDFSLNQGQVQNVNKAMKRLQKYAPDVGDSMAKEWGYIQQTFRVGLAETSKIMEALSELEYRVKKKMPRVEKAQKKIEQERRDLLKEAKKLDKELSDVANDTGENLDAAKAARYVVQALDDLDFS